MLGVFSYTCPLTSQVSEINHISGNLEVDEIDVQKPGVKLPATFDSTKGLMLTPIYTPRKMLRTFMAPVSVLQLCKYGSQCVKLELLWE